MPELPEVEHIARGLHERLPGRTVRGVTVRWERCLAAHTPQALEQAIVGLTFQSVSRRAKFLLLELPPYWLIVHLRMTGRLFFCETPQPEWETHPHVHVVLELDGDARLYYRDVRKFGRLYLTRAPQEIVGGLGAEPLAPDFTAERLGDILRGRRRQLKPLLLDQRALAGLGNIYVDEALWLAGLHPLVRSDSLSDKDVARLHASIRQVLHAALAHGGTTLRDYRGPDGQTGTHQHALAVYGRAQTPCLRCGAPIRRIVVGQRGTHYCPACQPAPPTLEEMSDDDLAARSP
jgi:formamidopyrimidine-DNA glycosylase